MNNIEFRLLLVFLVAAGPWPLRAQEKQTHKVEISFGHGLPAATTLEPRLSGTGAGVEVSAPRKTLKVGAGIVDSIPAEVSWGAPARAKRKTHEIWEYLLRHGTADQVARLKDDPGLTPDAPLLTVFTAPDETRGFTVGLEQLARHKAFWLPEHAAFVRLAGSEVAFEKHLASLNGARVLDRTRREPEASLEDYRRKWEDIGNPNVWKSPWETRWLGTVGHLIGTVARHGSLYKFGIDRWANVRPDFASPHKFRLDLLWPGATWLSQRIEDGLPIIDTLLEREGQKCAIEQFASASGNAPSNAPGMVPSVFFTRIRLTGSGPIHIGIGLSTESTNRHPELREADGRHHIVDRETGTTWLMLRADAELSVTADAAEEKPGQPRIVLSVRGQLAPNEAREVVLILASPPGQTPSELASLDYAEGRAATVRYWEDWLRRGANFSVPENEVNDLFRANLWHALMLPRFRADGAMDLPYSNFAYGQANADWPINQAVYVDYMLYGLRGYFDVAEAEFASMYRTQQKPDGRIGGYADWGVYSPSLLYSIGQNFLLSNDRASFARLLPESLKTLDWCLGQLTRDAGPENATGLVVAPLNDLTHESRAWAFPNAYYVAGLDLFGRALDRFGHARARDALAAARRLRTEVERAFARAAVRAPLVQLADGTWNNYVPTDALTPRRMLEVWYPTDVDCGPMHLARLDAIDSKSWLTTAMLHDHEDNLFLNQWGAANEPVYNPQATVYLRRDEPEAAIRAFYSMMACAFSHHQLSPLEHRWAWGQYYCPPSTDGAWFELYRNMLLNEFNDRLMIGQAIPRAWLADGKRIQVSGAPTWFGPVDLQLASAASEGRLTATVEFKSARRPPWLTVRFRHPSKKRLTSVTVNGAEWKRFDPQHEWVEIPGPQAATYRIVARF